LILNKLPREARLCGAANYTGRFASKRRSRHFILLSRSNNASIGRIGVSLSKKYIPLAVVRNRIRRQAKELFRTSDSLNKPQDLVLRAIKKIMKADLAAVKLELKQLWLQQKK
jgi:ribonuclease P protein component